MEIAHEKYIKITIVDTKSKKTAEIRKRYRVEQG